MSIYLPRFLGDADADTEPALSTPSEAGLGETVLVIDDEATIRHLVDEVLDELG